MTTTTLAVVALAGAIGAGNSPSPGWQTDFNRAKTLATAEGKPLAVFIGQGPAKVQQLVDNGTIPTDAAELLRDKYVCVALEAGSEKGKELAEQLSLKEGLMIGSSTGNIRALRDGSALHGPDLTRQLREYSTPAVAQTTASVTYPATVPTTYPTATPISYPVQPFAAPVYGSSCPNGQCGLRPVFVGGGCPNGQCPLQR